MFMSKEHNIIQFVNETLCVAQMFIINTVKGRKIGELYWSIRYDGFESVYESIFFIMCINYYNAD